MPSQPSLQALSNTIAPSPSKCWLSTMLRSESESWSSFASFRRVPASRRRKGPRTFCCHDRGSSQRPQGRSRHKRFASPSIKHDRAGRAATAEAMEGKRDVKSLPLRVISRTPALPLRARMRKPSCLISCSQSGPDGGALAGEARHGPIILSPGRVPSRNDMPDY